MHAQDIEHGCLVEGLCALLLGLGAGLQQRLVAMVAAYSKAERQRCMKRGRGGHRCIGGRMGRRRRRGEAEEGRQGNGRERLQQLVMLAVFAKTAHQCNRD